MDAVAQPPLRTFSRPPAVVTMPACFSAALAWGIDSRLKAAARARNRDIALFIIFHLVIDCFLHICPEIIAQNPIFENTPNAGSGKDV